MMIPACFDSEVSAHLHPRGFEPVRYSHLDDENRDRILGVEF